jgi:hypothetical protein
MTTSTLISLDTVVTQVASLMSNKIDDEIVMMSVENDMYYGMDIVGSRVWELLAHPQSVANVCEALMAEFDVDQETCHREVLAFVEKLYEYQVIQIVPSAAA